MNIRDRIFRNFGCPLAKRLISRLWHSQTVFYLKNGTATLKCDLLGRLTVTVINSGLFLLDTSIVIASYTGEI